MGIHYQDSVIEIEVFKQRPSPPTPAKINK